MKSKKLWNRKAERTKCKECGQVGSWNIHRSHYEAKGKYVCENCEAEGVEIVGGSVWDDELPAKGLHGQIERVEA